MENMIKRVAKVYGISEGEVELEIYRMIGEQIRTGTDVSKKCGRHLYACKTSKPHKSWWRNYSKQ